MQIKEKQMGIFDIFKSKKIKPVTMAPDVVPVTPVKNSGRKKKEPFTLTEGKVKRGGTIPADKAPSKKPKSPTGQKPKKKAAKKSNYQISLEKAKEEATKKGEPWISVLNVELDMDNLSNGSFNLDWNDFFIAKLVRAGYKGTDTEMVDAWFQNICRNILQENFEQDMADPDKRTEFNYPRNTY
jgi:hypothetical protein